MEGLISPRLGQQQSQRHPNGYAHEVPHDNRKKNRLDRFPVGPHDAPPPRCGREGAPANRRGLKHPQ